MKSLLFCAVFVFLMVAPSAGEQSNEKDSTVAYVKASLPTQIFRCLQKLNLLRCLKYFVLLRLESRDYHAPETDQSTSEFLGSILKNEENLPKEIPQYLLSLNEEELNQRLTDGFQRFFKHRPIMLRFIPDMLVKIVPSKSSDLEFSIKKFEENDFNSRQARKSKDKDSKESSKESSESNESSESEKEHAEGVKEDDANDKGMRRKSQYLTVGVPLAIAPAMVFAGFLPMMIPLFKLATAFTFIVNTTALAAAFMYLARQHALEREVQSTIYFNPGYKERK